ncbi:hypothetical protein L21SP5_01489 [Salinivirga cyanobacteriivorans]|uniref:Uncharacterized protein n=1 Tax=Salinivirga cyanobacteriivorans TaxID=1307839 RepID=A0A0S2HYN2_9BACT|nr:hypothetical protein L21SP5_01489 [Salinivirga cyanobacteriivorans]
MKLIIVHFDLSSAHIIHQVTSSHLVNKRQSEGIAEKKAKTSLQAKPSLVGNTGGEKRGLRWKYYGRYYKK